MKRCKDQRNDDDEEGAEEEGKHVEKVLRSCKAIVKYHSFMDPHPADVEEEWKSLGGRIEEEGQYEKKNVLLKLGQKLVRGVGLAEEEEEEEGRQTQVDFYHRVLLFLVRSSKDVFSTLVQDSAVRMLEGGKEGVHVVMMMKQGGEESDDDDDEEGMWWKSDIAYSSGDELSDWGSDETSTDVRGDDRRGRKDGLGGNNGDLKILSDSGQALRVEEAKEHTLRGAGMLDKFMDSIEAESFLRSRIRPVVREAPYGGIVGNEKFSLHKYGPMSLAVMLASRRKMSHINEALNPRYCVCQEDFILQVRSSLCYCHAAAMAVF